MRCGAASATGRSSESVDAPEPPKAKRRTPAAKRKTSVQVRSLFDKVLAHRRRGDALRSNQAPQPADFAQLDEAPTAAKRKSSVQVRYTPVGERARRSPESRARPLLSYVSLILCSSTSFRLYRLCQCAHRG